MRGLHIAIVVSVILNLFLAGALVAGFVALRANSRMINAGALRIAGAELPGPERHAFRQALRDARNTMAPAIARSRAAKLQAADLLRRPQVDQAAVMAALDQARADDIAVRAAVERRAVAFAATLPPADRAKLGDVMQQRAGPNPVIQNSPNIHNNPRDGKSASPR
jgi:uncharacterized membrane protein